MTTDRNGSHNSTEELLAQAETMIWSLLDDNLPEAEMPRLEEMVQNNDCVRERYLECVQLHSDLAGHFGGGAKLNIPITPSTSESPVLGSLGGTKPGADVGPPVID